MSYQPKLIVEVPTADEVLEAWASMFAEKVLEDAEEEGLIDDDVYADLHAIIVRRLVALHRHASPLAGDPTKEGNGT